MSLFTDWYLNKHLQITLSTADLETLHSAEQYLIDNALEQKQVFVHRDYHSRNLMYLNDDTRNIGIIDFQDAVSGPITYDLVSLLRDCYISWPESDVSHWVTLHHQQLCQSGLIDCDLSTFIRWFDLMGIQRHMKAVGIFARLNYRDNKPSYLDDIPRTLNYLISVSQRYPELKTFSNLISMLSQHQVVDA